MKYLHLSFADAASNLACDEALLDLCESKGEEEILRVWQPQGYFVVVGYSNRVNVEVNVAACAARGIPILRRFSGGGTVLQGPGCLNYSLVLKNDRPGSSSDIAGSYEIVLRRHQRLFGELTGEKVRIEGISDLAIAGKKFSGNAQHRKRRYTLFHGTFLLGLKFCLVGDCLPIPSKQPEYRRNRSHDGFLRNLAVDAQSVRDGLKTEWGTGEVFNDVPYEEIQKLVRDRYSRAEWTLKF